MAAMALAAIAGGQCACVWSARHFAFIVVVIDVVVHYVRGWDFLLGQDHLFL